MRGGRVLVIVGIIVLLGAIAVGAILYVRARQAASDLAEEALAELEGQIGEGGVYVPPGTREILLAAVDIKRGERLASDWVEVQYWPEQSVPAGALVEADVDERVAGRIARVDILQHTPILEDMLTDSPYELGAMGSNAALQIPPGKVAFALPVARYSSVAWALQPGDHVDVLISLLIVDLDEEFQSALPNKATCVQPSEDEGCRGGVMGRLEVLPNGWVVNLNPGEDQRARLVTQMTVQDAVVMRVGDWPIEQVAAAQGEEVPEWAQELEAQGAEVQVAEGETVPPTATRASIEPLTLIVDPQDAMVLKYAQETGANIDLVLRSAGDTQLNDTDSVTLQYLFGQYGIELPPKLPYGVTPPIEKVPSISTEEIEGSSAGEPVGQ
jgi:Flp pilus assembly protein CpaB